MTETLIQLVWGFNSTMVRLEYQRDYPADQVYHTFQFHDGAIRIKLEVSTVEEDEEFQFHDGAIRIRRSTH